MKIFVAVGFILACIVCGLNAACTGRNDCPLVNPPAESLKKIEYIYEGETCDCEKKHKFTVEIPKTAPTIKPYVEVGYEVEIPSVKNDQIKRYRYDAKIDQPATDKPTENKPGDYAYDIKVPPTTDDKIIRYRYDSKIETPAQPSCDHSKIEGLHSKVDRVLAPKKGPCRFRDHSPSCNCGATYTIPFNFNRRYGSNSLLNNYYTEMRMGFVDKAVENSLSPLKREKREKTKKPLKVKKLSKRTRNSRTKPNKKSLKKKRIRSRELSKFNRIPGVQVRRKRIPNDASPCGYSFKSCDVNNPNVNRKTCPLCYQCKCEPTNIDKQVKIEIPYKTAPMHQELHESHELGESPKKGNDKIRQQFQSAPASYVGLPPDMYKKYIGQILSKYPEYMQNKMPDYSSQQEDLMKFVGELAKSRIQQEYERPYARSQKSEDVKYKLIDDAVNLYELYENSQVKKSDKNQKNVAATKSNNKRGTILEVIELDSDEIQSFEHLLEKDFA